MSPGRPKGALRALHALTLLALVSAAGLFVARSVASGPAPPALPAFSAVPAFALRDAAGRVFSLRDLEGRVWIADFIFTRCAGQCPILSSQMSALTGRLPGVDFVSFSVDPEYDTPERLAEYARRYDAPERWRFLTGDAAETSRVTTALGMGALGDPMMHSSSLVLVDARGRVRGYYDAKDPDAQERLVEDARALAGGKNDAR